MSQIGRPSSYSDDIAERIVERLMEGEALLQIVQDEGMPSRTTVYRWTEQNAAFRDNIARARQWQAWSLHEQGVVLAQKASTDPDLAPALRVQLDAIKWATAKLAPKHFGDKIDLNHGGQEGNPFRAVLDLRE